MKLLIDIGNTRVKWGTLLDQSLCELRALPHANWNASDVRNQLINRNVKPQSVWISNVGGDEMGQLIAAVIQKDWGVEAKFARTTAECAGVRCGYAQPQKLGIDRWLSVIAAHRCTSQDTCVVSVGTAMTIDGVTRDGQHLGGVIVPGPDLMVDSLLANTSNIAKHAGDGELRDTLFADNTLAAVHQGAHHALAALIERAVCDMQAKTSAAPVLLITGGASASVVSKLRIPFQTMPDLVLRGLAIASESASAPVS
jgi:type III pantothenate kinase